MNYKNTTLNGRKISKHRIIMEAYLGRKLNYNEIIHHRNGNIQDNRIENLELQSRSEHSKRHARHKEYIDLICPMCGNNFKKPKRKYLWRKKQGQRKCFCSIRCGVLFNAPSKVKNIDDLISKELTNGLTVYAIAKKHSLDKGTVMNHVKRSCSLIGIYLKNKQ